MAGTVRPDLPEVPYVLSWIGPPSSSVDGGPITLVRVAITGRHDKEPAFCAPEPPSRFSKQVEDACYPTTLGESVGCVLVILPFMASAPFFFGVRLVLRHDRDTVRSGHVVLDAFFVFFRGFVLPARTRSLACDLPSDTQIGFVPHQRATCGGSSPLERLIVSASAIGSFSAGDSGGDQWLRRLFATKSAASSASI